MLEGVGGYECGDHLPGRISERGRRAYERMVADLVVNPGDVELSVSRRPAAKTRGVGPGDYDYVIITKTDWVDDFQPLADWKTQKGVPAAIVTTTWIYSEYTGGNVAQIRAFVQDAHANWGATYFLLGGDTDVVPYHSRSFPSIDPYESVPNDTYYADYDDDWTCEVHVGRASVANTAAIGTFNGKVFTYEKNPPLSDYAKTATFLGCDQSCGGGEGENCKTDIKDLYLPASWTYRREYDSEPGTHKTDFIAYLNLGNNLVDHIDHC
ncbi:unnamed protein product, partial [marine sediment metagenome]